MRRADALRAMRMVNRIDQVMDSAADYAGDLDALAMLLIGVAADYLPAEMACEIRAILDAAPDEAAWAERLRAYYADGGQPPSAMIRQKSTLREAA